MRAVRAPSGANAAEARIVDDVGKVIAERSLVDRGTRACVPLAHAVGAWATLVLDAELGRARDQDDASDPSWSRRREESFGASSSDGGAGNDGTGVRLGPLGGELPPPGEAVSTPVAKRTIELGSIVYLRNGLAAVGGVVGGSPFVTIEVDHGWFLRPSVAFGRSTSPIALGRGNRMVILSQLGLRFDVCRRWGGNYLERRGIEVDLCSGTDVSLVDSDLARAGRLLFESSAGMRGELGAGLALEVRALGGVNVLRQALLAEGSAPLISAAAELGVSVRLP